MSLQGQPATTLTLASVSESGEHRLTAVVPEGPYTEAIEVILETDAYWTTIDDPRMKSFYLMSAEVN
jgi:hypothetical protein